MPSIHIDLQEGFSKDRVVVEIDGHRLECESVSTRRMLGYADTLSAKVSSGPVRIRVDVPTRDISRSFEIRIVDDIYVGISLMRDTLISQESSQPFTYL
jgi:hypothetical protein